MSTVEHMNNNKNDSRVNKLQIKFFLVSIIIITVFTTLLVSLVNINFIKSNSIYPMLFVGFITSVYISYYIKISANIDSIKKLLIDRKGILFLFVFMYTSFFIIIYIFTKNTFDSTNADFNVGISLFFTTLISCYIWTGLN
jgi:hypothetical protein